MFSLTGVLLYYFMLQIMTTQLLNDSVLTVRVSPDRVLVRQASRHNVLDKKEEQHQKDRLFKDVVCICNKTNLVQFENVVRSKHTLDSKEEVDLVCKQN